MKIKNVRPWPVELPGVGANVPPGGTVDVAKDVADRLLLQPANWRKATTNSKSEQKDG